MKPSPFRYEAPTSVDEAIALLAEHGADARILAGGQSLVPAMNLRVECPAVIVDINRVPGLDTLHRDDDVLTIGPLARHRSFETPPIDGIVGDLIARTAHLIAHPPIRTRGTLLGSLAFGDPAAEWCAVTQLFDGEVTARSIRGDRTLRVDELLAGAFSTSLAPDEMLVEARLRLPGGPLGAAIVEQSHTVDDFAVVLAAALTVRGEDGGARHRVAIGGAAPTAKRMQRLERELDRDPTIADDADAIRDLIVDELDPPEDAYGSAEYRRHLAAILTRRALGRARS